MSPTEKDLEKRAAERMISEGESYEEASRHVFKENMVLSEKNKKERLSDERAIDVSLNGNTDSSKETLNLQGPLITKLEPIITEGIAIHTTIHRFSDKKIYHSAILFPDGSVNVQIDEKDLL